MNPEMAMRQYINILSDNIPGWMKGQLAVSFFLFFLFFFYLLRHSALLILELTSTFNNMSIMLF